MKLLKKGRIFVIDGGDGSGKNTTAKLVCESLLMLKHKVIMMEFPGYEHNPVGGLIRECLDGLHGNFMNLDPKITSVLYAADRSLRQKEIMEYYNKGYYIILDRYVSSNQIHQLAKLHMGSSEELKVNRKILFDWIHNLEHDHMKLPTADAVFYLDVPTEISMELIALDTSRNGLIDQSERDTIHQNRARYVANWLCDTVPGWYRIECAPQGFMLAKRTIMWKVIEELSKQNMI